MKEKEDKQIITFRAPEVIARELATKVSKTEYILQCIEEKMARDKGLGINRLGKVYRADDLEPLMMNRFDMSVVAGYPVTMDNSAKAEQVNLLQVMCPNPESCFLIDVNGYSMIDANINDGDVIVIDRSNRFPTEHDVALCELNGDYTVKYVRRHDGKSWLVPANPEYHEVEITMRDTFSVWGVVTHVIHNMSK